MEKFIRRLTSANKELILVLWIVSILWVIHYFAVAHRSFLNFYNFPVIFAAYFFGRYLGTLTALLSFLFVILLTWLNPKVFSLTPAMADLQRWLDILTWGAFLILTGYAMGALHESKEQKMQQLRETYYGVLELLSYLLSKDKYTHSHSCRTAVYSTRIARYMGLDEDRIEDIRAAALLHDIGKLEISRDILYKAAKLTEEEFEEMKKHPEKGAALFLKPVGGTLRRVIPIILAHHEKIDGSGYYGQRGDEIPLEAKIIAVADYYDALISDRPYRKGLPPWEVKEAILKASGRQFDPRAVDAFVKAFENGAMEISHEWAMV